MNYQFPVIKHLDDVRPAIEGRDEFIIAERDWGYVVNYMVAMTDTFPSTSVTDDMGFIQFDLWAAIRRECRGLLFHKDGTIMARRLHKFFNVNERDETQFGVIDFSKPHVILEKLDGSMITPVVTDAGIRWGTKMGVTDVSMGAELFVAHHPQYEQFARWCLSMRLTPIFEWCSRKQRIVIDYPEDRLVLIALRGTETGEYKQYCDLIVLGEKFNIEVVKTYEGTAANMSHLMDETKAAEGVEGYIIRFDDGHMLKIKGEWYLRIHKTKDNLTHEKNVIDLLVNEKMDDVKAFMMDEDRKRVDEFEAVFWDGFARQVEAYDKYFGMVLASKLDRKEYALKWMPTIKDQDPFAAQIVFGKFDGKDTWAMMLDIVRKNTGTQTKIDTVRHLWGGAQWNYHFVGDA
jgi:RNA ligase